MRSTRAAAAVARLNTRSGGKQYLMAVMGSGQFKLFERIEGAEKALSEELSLDDFVRFVDGLGPQKIPRVTKSDAAFAKQLVRKPTGPDEPR